ncbi:MBL fold metallo-hydrolase [Pseudooceanicola lipolyticus]|uniref:MBL fold metallo-hydrolase n=1 Tax=Pseudooceanicola TaxID=1679449 RepID=UPI00197F5666|nr:MBL fold metallo-hydrolase [Pseudooceanicola lipolyticus]
MRDTDVTAEPWIEVQSGLGEKGPACLRLWTGTETWILDVGVGPEATSPFVPAWLDGADRVLISHDHIDHIGGAAHAIAAGLPIHCTPQTARALPPAARVHDLPERGVTEIAGVRVTTGRNGHALGGVWMHLDLGDGFFYSGDWSEESDWFAFDTPPGAATAMIDASYHLDDVTQAARKTALDRALSQLRGHQLLFPVPPSGRAGELALHLYRHGDVSFDEACRDAVAGALLSGSLAEGADQLAPLLNKPFDPAAQYLVCDTPNADAGMSWRMVQDWRDAGRLGHDAVVLFTGHMTAHARAIASQGGRFLRWNVHPPLGDQIEMIRRLGARRFAPLFSSRPEDYLLEPRFDAQLVLHERCSL